MGRIQLLLIIFSFAIVDSGNCQQQFQIHYSNLAETNGISIDYSLNGGYILLDASFSNQSSSIDLQKLNTTFGTEWTRSFMTPDSAVYPVTMKETDDGSILIASKVMGQNQTSIHLLQMDSSGALLWNRRYSRTNDDEPKSILTLSDGSFYVCGTSQLSSSISQKDILLSRISSTGQVQWSQLIGGTREEDPSLIIRTSDDQLAIAGTSNSFSNGNNFFLTKLDTSGNYYWFMTYTLGLNDTCRSLLQTNDGGYLMVGTGGSNGQDILMIKTDINGSLEFARTYDLSFSSNSLLDDGYRVLSTADGGLVIAGTTCLSTNQASFLFLIKLSQNLVTEWFSSYGFQYTNSFSGIIQTPDNGYLMHGSRRNSITNHQEGLLIKTDSMGYSLCHETSLNKNDLIVNPLQFSASPSISSVLLNSYNDTLLLTSPALQYDTACFLVADINQYIVPDDDDVKIHPNPFKDEMYIHLPFSGIRCTQFDWILQASSGKVIQGGQIESGTGSALKLETPLLEPGIYIVTITCVQSHQTWKKKVICID